MHKPLHLSCYLTRTDLALTVLGALGIVTVLWAVSPAEPPPDARRWISSTPVLVCVVPDSTCLSANDAACIKRLTREVPVLVVHDSSCPQEVRSLAPVVLLVTPEGKVVRTWPDVCSVAWDLQ